MEVCFYDFAGMVDTVDFDNLEYLMPSIDAYYGIPDSIVIC